MSELQPWEDSFPSESKTRGDIKKRFQSWSREDLINYLSNMADDLKLAEDTDVIIHYYEDITGKKFND